MLLKQSTLIIRTKESDWIQIENTYLRTRDDCQLKKCRNKIFIIIHLPALAFYKHVLLTKNIGLVLTPSSDH